MAKTHTAPQGSGAASGHDLDVDIEALLKECDFAPGEQCQHQGYTMTEIRNKIELPEGKIYRLVHRAIEQGLCRVERRPRTNIAGTVSIKPVYIFKRGE